MISQIRVRWVSGRVMCSMLWTHSTMVSWVPGRFTVLVSSPVHQLDLAISWMCDFKNEARNLHKSMMTPLKISSLSLQMIFSCIYPDSTCISHCLPYFVFILASCNCEYNAHIVCDCHSFEPERKKTCIRDHHAVCLCVCVCVCVCVLCPFIWLLCCLILSDYVSLTR
jgi:hypothetical protein